MMNDLDMGWRPKTPGNATPKPRLERQRSELPRGGKDVAAQIGAELRAVFAPMPAGHLVGADDLLSQIDGWSDRWNRDCG
jgi:hypothetical protein